jgi:putative ABC transport system permease protein
VQRIARVALQNSAVAGCATSARQWNSSGSAARVAGRPRRAGHTIAELATVQKAPGVAAAAGIARGSLDIMKTAGSTGTSGADGRLWITVPQLNPFTIVQGQAPAQAGQIAIDAATAESLGLSVGSSVPLKTSSGPQQATVVGITNFGEQQAANSNGDIFVSSADLASYLQSGVDQYDAIYVAAQPGQADSVTASVQQAVGSEYSVIDRAKLQEEQGGAAGGFADAIGTGLQAFAYVALFVCLFVVYNTFSIVVAQSVREFALLRAIGADTKQIRKSVRREALISGLLGSAAGLALGTVLVALLLKLLPALKSVAGSSVSVRLGLGTILQVMIVGTLITPSRQSSVVHAGRTAHRALTEAGGPLGHQCSGDRRSGSSSSGRCS